MITLMSDTVCVTEEGLKIFGPVVKTKAGNYCVTLKDGPNKTCSLEVDQKTMDELVKKVKSPMLEETKEFLNYFGEWNFNGDSPPEEYQ